MVDLLSEHMTAVATGFVIGALIGLALLACWPGI
jgi:hypothetical protein